MRIARNALNDQLGNLFFQVYPNAKKIQTYLDTLNYYKKVARLEWTPAELLKDLEDFLSKTV